MKKLLFLFAFLCLATIGVNAQTITWTGAVNNNWNVAGNWDPAQIPTNVNDVIIPTGSTMTINVAASVLSMDIQGTAVVTMSSNFTFAAASSVATNAVVNWTAGSISGPSTFTNNGVFNLSTTTTKSIIGSTIFDNEGTFNITDSGDFNIMDGIFNNQLAGVIDMQADAGNISYAGSASRILNNFGVIKKTTSTGPADILVELNNNNGTISVESGTLNFLSLDKTLTDGTYNVANGSSLGWHTNINVAGTLTGVLEGEINWANTVTVPSPTTAIFNFSGSNGINWSAGNLTGGGTLVNQSLFNLTTTATKSIHGLTNLNNEATFNIASSGDFNITDGIFNNQPSGVIDMQVDAGNISYSGTATRILNNYGLIKRTSIGIAAIDVELNSMGIISVESGTLNFLALDKTLTNGTYNVALGSSLGWNTNIVVAGTLTGVLDGQINWTNSVTVPVSTTAIFDFSGNGINWSDGNLMGGGTLVNQSLFNLTTTSTKSIVGLTNLNNEATFNIADSGDLNITNGVFNNQVAGVIDMQADAGNINYSGSASRILNNYGLIKRTGIGIASIETILNNNNGTISVESGTLNFISLDKTLTDGTYNVANGSVLGWNTNINVAGTLIGVVEGEINWTNDVTVPLATTATFNFSGSNGINWSDGSLTGGGTLINQNLFNLTTTDTKSIIGFTAFNNEGTFNIASSGDLNITDGIFNNQLAGVIDMQTDAGNISYAGSASRVLNNFGLIKRTTSTGAADILVELNNNDGIINVESGTLNFISLDKTLTDGTYNVANASSLGWHTNINVAGTLTGVLDGQINWTSTVTVVVTVPPSPITAIFDFSGSNGINWSAGTLTGGGTLVNQSLFNLTTTSIKSIVGLTNLNNEATFNIVDNGDLYITDGVFNNQPTGILDLQVDAGDISYTGSASRVLNNFGLLKKSAGTGTTNIFTQTTNSGTIEAMTGTLAFADPLGLTNTVDGTIKGIATIDIPATANYTNDGTFAPGASPGTLTVVGAFKSSASSVLEVELNGLIQGTEYDLLAITGSAIMDGNVNIILGFDASVGDEFIVATTTATITQCSLPATAFAEFDCLRYDFSVECRNDNEVVLTVTAKGDVEPPVVITQNITVQLDNNGTVTIAAMDVDGGSTDNCTLPENLTFAIDISTFTCTDIGANTVTLTVTDETGNSASAEATVTVEDTVAPTVITQDITLQLDASGNATISVNDIDNGSTDNCTIAILSLDITEFDCSNIGENTVNLTAEDQSGNSTTAAATVTVEDSMAPVVITQDITVQLDASGNTIITANDIDNGSTDNCTIAILSLDITEFDCSNIGENTVNLTAEDQSGNITTVAATVTVEDTIEPEVICQNITVQLDATGNATITPEDIDNGSSDACGNVTLSLDIDTFDCSNMGENTVILTVTDSNGNTNTCNATVTVEDSVDPVALCQNITVQLDASGNATISAADVDNGSSDACGVSLSIDTNTFNCSNVGENTVTLTVTDTNGNTSTCTTTVTVEDNVAPIAICQNITVQLDGSGNASITGDDVDGGSSDACGITSVSVSPNTFDVSDVGENTVTLTVTDVNGNVSTCEAIVTVEDEGGPTAICQDITIQLDASGNATISPADIDNGSFGNNISLSINVSAFDCSDVGGNIVTLTVTDNDTGNTDTCTATVTVEDNVNPVATCQNITVQLDGSGNASITGDDVDGGSSDPCGILSLSVSPDTFDVGDVGENLVTLTVTDVNGNVSTCEATVTVEDVEGPTAICQDITVQLDASGNATIESGDVDNGSSGNGISLSLDNDSFDCSNVGGNTVTLTVTDSNGNTDTCTATVTVEDNVNPVAICQNITVQLDGSGNATITAADVNNGSSDACGVSLSIEIDTFDCSNVGANTVTLTVTDSNGNTDTCTATVTVEDNIAPTAICQNITVQLDGSGNATITAADVDNGSSDACGVSLSIDTDTFNCSNVGENTVTLTVTDTNGNTSTCISTVTVGDNVAPIAICQNITVQLDGSGNASITGTDVDGGSTDACGILSLNVSPDTFDTSDVGENTVTLTVTDVNGNVSTCEATVTVQDVEGSTAICQNITVQLDASGNATIEAGDVDNGSSGNGISLSLDNDSFDCSNVGANTVTLTVTDSNGNTDTCTATVTVEDNVAPVALCQNITVQLDATGNATITAADVDNGSSDACGVSLSIDMDSFNCSNVGANSVILTVTDSNGNTDTCTSTITVEDNVNPVVICQNITVQLDASGNASITGNDVDGGSSDACGVLSLSVSPDTFDMGDVGENTVTLTVTDMNGNVSTCQATVTVEDVEGPTAICQNITVQLDASGNATIEPGDVDNGSSGNGISLSLDNDSFDCSNVGENTVTLTVTDSNGNTDTCTATVTVEDGEAFSIECPENQRINPGVPGGSYVLPDYFAIGLATVNSNCGNTVASTTQSPAPGTIMPQGNYTIFLSATDVLGNTVNCSFKLTVRYQRERPRMGTIIMYPNIAKEKVTLSNPEQIEMEEALIFDLTGRLIKTINLQNMDIEKTIDISELSNATYLVILKGAEGQIVKKLQKE